MNDTRAKITTEIQKIIANHGLRLRGSWLYGEQHFVPAQGKLFSLSDIDILSDTNLSQSSEESLRTEIKVVTDPALLVAPSISIRNTVINDSASKATNHNTLFWAYIALLEYKHALTNSANEHCDAESYFSNKFLLNIWRNILLDAGQSPTSYASIIDTLDNFSTEEKKNLLLIKRGEHSPDTTKQQISRFHNYTATWVERKSPSRLRVGLLDILSPNAYTRSFSAVFDKLAEAATTETERGVITYSRAKLGKE